MRLVRVQHDDLAGPADLGRPAIVEGLVADIGQADGIGVVAMRVVAMSGKPGLEYLHAGRQLPGAHPVGRSGRARSFKTAGAAAA